MRDLIRSSKSILILLPEKFCADIAASALGLADILDNGKDNTVKIGSSEQIPKEFTQIFDFSTYKIINTLTQREVVLSLNRKKGVVKAVRWRETDDRIQFIITPDEGEFEFNDVDLENIGGEFDLVITVGCKNLESTGKLYSSNQDFFQNIKILNIDINPANSNYGTVNKISPEQSLSSWILKLAGEENLPLTETATESLFKGIFWANEGFRKNDGLGKALKKLTETQVNFTTTIAQMYNTLTVAELRYIGKIISNMQIDSNGLIKSKVKNNEIQGVRLDRTLYPEINIISRVKDYKIALILSEYEKEKVFVRLYSKDKEFDVFEIFSDYTPVGNSRRVTFNMEGNLDEIETNIISKLYGKQPVEITDSQEIKKDETKSVQKDSDSSPNNKSGSINKPLQKAETLPPPVEAPIVSQIQPQFRQAAVPQTQRPPINPIYPSQPLPPAPQVT